MIAFGALSGGVASELSGGNFWEGAITGGIVAGLNHVVHRMSNEFDNGGEDDPYSPTHKKKIRFSEAKKNARTDGKKMYQDISVLDLDIKNNDFNKEGWVRVKMDSPRNMMKYGEDAIVHGTITLERLPENPHYAQVKFDPQLGCRCGRYDFEIHTYKGASSYRNTLTALAGILHIRNPSAIFKGGIIYGARSFNIQYTNVIKIK